MDTLSGVVCALYGNSNREHLHTDSIIFALLVFNLSDRCAWGALQVYDVGGAVWCAPGRVLHAAAPHDAALVHASLADAWAPPVAPLCVDGGCRDDAYEAGPELDGNLGADVERRCGYGEALFRPADYAVSPIHPASPEPSLDCTEDGCGERVGGWRGGGLCQILE
jgi:hypothetical protein